MGRLLTAVQLLTIVRALGDRPSARGAILFPMVGAGRGLATGKLNQQAAEATAEVCWIIFGIPLKVK